MNEQDSKFCKTTITMAGRVAAQKFYKVQLEWLFEASGKATAAARDAIMQDLGVFWTNWRKWPRD
jgi:hypothetical protein